MMDDAFHTSKKPVRKFSVQDVGLRTLATKLLPRNLAEERRRDISLCAWTLQNIFQKIIFLDHVITGDEAWCSQYDPDAKRQYIEWRSKKIPHAIEATMSNSKIRKNLICFLI
jgi:hypothetical protein